MSSMVEPTMHGSTLWENPEKRLLSDVNHLLANKRNDGSIPETVLEDVRVNRYTALQEMGMPGAVTTTVQQAEFTPGSDGRLRRTFTWLGKSALQVAESGYDFHFSAAAYARVDCECAEAVYSEETLLPGVAQGFISPRMSWADASERVARQEHLSDDDAIRVSTAVTDKAGAVTGRRIQSLLVSDIPLEAWVAMLEDPDNILGRSVRVRDEHSALSVMEIFRELSVPEENLPEGPISLVEAVIPYITEDKARESVTGQLRHFREDQEICHAQAAKLSEEWLAFDVAVADSLEAGIANADIERFIGTLQHEWDEDDLRVLRAHDTEDGYIMTGQLAALLERAQGHLLASRAALMTDSRKLQGQADAGTIRRLQENIREVEAMPAQLRADQALRQAELMRIIAAQNFTVGGGCAGELAFKRAQQEGDEMARLLDGQDQAESDATAGEAKANWAWSSGSCRVRNCVSPNPTEVGPCSVCRVCQHAFDMGRDPSGIVFMRPAAESGEASGRSDIIDYIAGLLAPEQGADSGPFEPPDPPVDEAATLPAAPRPAEDYNKKHEVEAAG